MNIRIGSSFDIHEKCASRPLILGGVKISDENGLIGHSDADVLTHVITESILGALGLDDLGKHFPDTSNKFKNISSILLLEKAKELMQELNFEICNIDTQIILDTPYLKDYKELIRKNLCSVLEIEYSQLNIKATRSENSITAITNDKAMFAFATILLKEKENGKKS